MRIVCISDTHGLHDKLKIPDGDLLIHSGDLCNTGTEQDVQVFAKWIDRLPHRWKIVIAGNHDWFFQQNPDLAHAYLEPGVIYLQDSGCEIEGLKFWGSPWQPWFQDWAFNLPRRGHQIREKWNLIPFDTDVLITHGPPHGVRDRVRPQGNRETEPSSYDPLGCEELAIRVKAVKPRLHVFGHIHDGHGTIEGDDTRFVNASICTEAYQPTNAPIVVELNPDG